MQGINPNIKRKRKEKRSIDSYLRGLQDGDRYVLGEALTLIESTDPHDREMAQAILAAAHTSTRATQRIAITGSPGVGKSTLIEALGKHYTTQGQAVAVLAVDPSSRVSSGSILGDKTRMHSLGQDPLAYIRPSPAGLTLGGVSRYTKECIQVCEFAGYQKIIVETVGVGQSETLVAEIVDLFVLLILPGSGDEVQGIKRGIMELADILLINKADEDRHQLATDSLKAYRAALQLLSPPHPHYPTRVRRSAGLSSMGIDTLANDIEDYYATAPDGFVANLRRDQDQNWFMRQLRQAWLDLLQTHSPTQTALAATQAQVEAGELDPYTALDRMISTLKSNT